LVTTDSTFWCFAVISTESILQMFNKAHSSTQFYISVTKNKKKSACQVIRVELNKAIRPPYTAD